MGLSVDVGDLIICQGIFTTVATGAAVDPTAVYFQVKAPDGTITSYQYGVDPEVQKLAVGQYTATVSATDDGDWYCRWYSTGTGQAAEEIKFNVKSSEFD